jgi:hypothetical protein
MVNTIHQAGQMGLTPLRWTPSWVAEFPTRPFLVQYFVPGKMIKPFSIPGDTVVLCLDMQV